MVLFRYIGRELLLVFLAVFGLLLAMGLGGRFVGYAQEAAGGRFAADALWTLLALRLPEFVQITTPFALFLALLLTFGRLHAEREYVALTSAGAAPGRIVAALLLGIAPLVAGIALLSFVATPEARRLYNEFSIQQLLDSDLGSMIPGAFLVYSGGRRATYAQSVDRDANELHGVFMAERRESDSVTMWAERGRQHRTDGGGRILELHNGTRYEGTAGQASYREVRFRRLGQRLQPQWIVPRADVRATPTRDLDTADPGAAAELHWRMAMPTMNVVAALLAFGAARPNPRAGRFARLLPGIGLFVCYYLLLVATRSFAADGTVPAGLGMCSVHALALATAIGLLRRSSRPR